MLQKIVAANAAPMPFEGRELPASISLGACPYPGRTDDLLKQADVKMYEAKTRRRQPLRPVRQV